jgi:hypothetical protein
LGGSGREKSVRGESIGMPGYGLTRPGIARGDEGSAWTPNGVAIAKMPIWIEDACEGHRAEGRCRMLAESGDQLIGRGTLSTYPELLGEIVGVVGDDGQPPYLVRWFDTGSESLFEPDQSGYWIKSKRHTRTRYVVELEMQRQGLRP